MSGRPKKRGRPCSKEATVRVRLRKSVYQAWKEKKKHTGFAKSSHSIFAEFLLHGGARTSPGKSKPAKRQRLDVQLSPVTDLHQRKPLTTSTPVRSSRRELVEGENNRAGTSTEVDITGVSCLEEHSTIVADMTSRCKDINSQFSSISEDPFQLGNSQTESDEETTESESDEFSNIKSLLNADTSSETDSESDISDSDIISYHSISDPELHPADLESCDFSETTLTAVEDQFPSEYLAGGSDSESEVAVSALARDAVVVDAGDESTGALPETATETKPLAAKLKDAFDSLIGCEKDVEKFFNISEKSRVVVTVDQLLTLFAGSCKEKGCGREREVKHDCNGGVLVVNWSCGGGHQGRWESSDVLCEKGHGQKIYTNTVLLAASILVTGNNFDKVSLLSRCLNLSFISRSTFNRVQRLYAVPAIKALWLEMQLAMENVFKDEILILAGDGRNDSPGFCAQYCVYSVMDEITKVIVDIEIKDKRETGGSSPAMEVAALKVILDRLSGKFKIGELTTDASNAVIALVKKLKDQYPSLSELYHNLDIWHKACKLTKALSEAAKVKHCDEIGQWIEPIRNHFWHCCESCGTDVNKLKESWFGVVHHVVGEHEWADGQCSHGPLTATEQEKTYLPKTSKVAEAVRKIVFDKQWLKSMVYYVNFRHTSGLESFNSMLAKYAPKRNSFEFLAYTARIILAVLDHNMHTFRPFATTKAGNQKYDRKYSKRTKKWHAQPAKVPKEYRYWPHLLGKILKLRSEDKESVRRIVPRPSDHPKNLAATIAMKQPTPTSELIQFRNMRFGQKKP